MKSDKIDGAVLDAGIAAASARGVTPVILVIPSAVRPVLINAVLARDEIAGLVLPSNVVDEIPSDDRIGRIREPEGDWQLPNVRGRSIVLLGGAGLLGVRRAWIAVRYGMRTIFHVDVLGVWHRIWLPRFVVFRGARRVFGAVLRWVNLAPVYKVVTFNDFVLVRLLGRWVRRRRPLSPENFVAGRILLVNNSLAPGGAERQLVNTAIGLADRGFEVSVLCNDLSSENGHDFYRPKLAGGMTVHELKRMWDYLSGENKDHNGAARASLVACGFEGRIPGLPVWVREDLLDYAAEFVTRRPQVVHLWQDYTNVIGGLAACYVGVPRIVLGMRNMAPFRFPYIQPFMRAAYKILADQPNVVLVNNSDAGAADYAAWLGIPRERLNVVRNGIDETHMQLPTPCEIRACRENLGLPADVFVVGSVFRFYPEKAPMLWVETAAAVARRRSDVVFLLVGWGPMQEKIMAHAAEAGITDRLYLPGPQDDVRSAISCMDVFLLNSRLEGSPNVLIEAQMMGVPVVTTIAGGSAETVEHGRTGWVVPGNNAEDLADRVLAILDDRPWAAQARAKASVHAGQRFGFARMIDDTLQAYGLGSDAGESRRFA